MTSPRQVADATDLAELVENPSDLPHGFELLTLSSTSPVAETARSALRTVCIVLVESKSEREPALAGRP
jgi:hypothetical protein